MVWVVVNEFADSSGQAFPGADWNHRINLVKSNQPNRAKAFPTMPGISIHVVDVSRGAIAAGLRIEIYSVVPAMTLIADGRLAASGLLEASELARTFKAGVYEARFHIADYYRSVGISLPEVPFLDVSSFRFGIDDPQQHYHLPFKMTPWGYSCFRGGA